MALLWFLTGLLIGQVHGEANANYDPDLDYRPQNITGLDYYYYPWKGSYYNGTVVFTVSEMVYRDWFNDDDHSLCSDLQKMTHSFSWPGLLAVTQTEGKERPENTNPVNLLLSTSYSNFTAYFTSTSSSNMAIGDEPWTFQSVSPPRYYYPTDGTPEFNLSVSGTSGPPFTITGSSTLDSNPLGYVNMNMSSCHHVEDVPWVVKFASKDWDEDGKLGVTNPTVDLTFDADSADIVIHSWAFMNTKDDDDHTPQVAAQVKIDFLGRLDAARSDILNEGSVPSWTPTLGFGNNSLNLDSQVESGGLKLESMRAAVSWGLVAVACFVFLIPL